MDRYNPQQKILLRKLQKGLDINESARLAGYSDSSASSYVYTMLKKPKMQRALDRAGLTDRSIAEGIKVNAEAGMGVKATASDSIRALELASRLKGHLERETPESLSQTNIYINELNQLSDKDLNAKVEELTAEVNNLKSP